MASIDCMGRCYCLVSDLDSARAAVAALGQADLYPGRLRVVARRGTLITGLPEAGIRERTGIVQAARRGVLMGSAGGTLTGLIAAIELPVPVLLAVGLVLGGGLVGSLFGAWTAAMMGIEEPHHDLRPYQEALDSGRVIIIIDDDDNTQTQAARRIIDQYAPAAMQHARDGKSDRSP